jgi:hypothetical protein
VAEGTPDELKARVGGEMLTVTDGAGTVLAELPTDGTLAGLRRALEGLAGDGLAETDAASVALRSPSLDDVFLAVTGAPATAAPASDREPQLATPKG